MVDVRAVQNIFYSSDDSSFASTAEESRLDFDTGVFYNLPLWREKMGYTELPGRSLLGFVKDPSYTHMFETLLRGDNGSNKFYFGQLRMDNNDVGINVNAAGTLPAGFAPPRPQETDMKTPLHGWKDRTTNNAAVVVGTLMRINDHIRLDDGRLMLHLHAVERFVVLEPKRLLPYPLANVMISPDEEELIETHNDIGTCVRKSLIHYNNFEFDETIRFPIERDEGDDYAIMSLAEIFIASGEDGLGSLLPFAHYKHSCLDEDSDHNINSKTKYKAAQNSGGAVPDMSELVQCNVIREVKSYSNAVLKRTINSINAPQTNIIEKELWVLIDEYVKLREVTNVFPKHLLSLLPRGIEWPEYFALDKLASVYSGVADDVNSFAFVADKSDYPNQRRQKRLSYSCTALLGGPVNDHPLLNRTMRRRLLEIPSTEGRLWAARELFEAYNSQFR